MAHSITLTANGVVKSGSGTLHVVNVTKATAGALQVYDNPTTNSGTLLFDGDGTTSQSYSMQSFGDGTRAATGLYAVVPAGAKVTIVYD